MEGIRAAVGHSKLNRRNEQALHAAILSVSRLDLESDPRTARAHADFFSRFIPRIYARYKKVIMRELALTS